MLEPAHRREVAIVGPARCGSFKSAKGLGHHAPKQTIQISSAHAALQRRQLHSTSRSDKRYTTGKPKRQEQWKKHRSKKAKRRHRKALQEYREANPAPLPALELPERTKAEQEEVDRRANLSIDLLVKPKYADPRAREAWLKVDPDAAVARLKGLRSIDERVDQLYGAAIHALGVHGRFDEAVALVPPLVQLGRQPNMEIYNSLINACARQRNLEAALSVLDSMRESGLEPDSITFGSLMHAANRAGQPDHALRLLSAAKAEGVMPTPSMYNTALHGLIQHQRVDDALTLFRQMGALDVAPDAGVYTTMIYGLGRQDRVELALKLFDDMKFSGVQPTHSTYGAMIYAAGRSYRHHMRAHALFDQMEEAGFRHDQRAFRAVLLACSHRGDVNKARDYLRRMSVEGIRPDRDTFNTLLTTYARGVGKVGKRPQLEHRDSKEKWNEMRDLVRDRGAGERLLGLEQTGNSSRAGVVEVGSDGSIVGMESEAAEELERERGLETSFRMPGTRQGAAELAQRLVHYYYDKEQTVDMQLSASQRQKLGLEPDLKRDGKGRVLAEQSDSADTDELLLGKARDGPADASIREPGRDKWTGDGEGLASYHQVLLDPRHKEARRRLEEAGFSEGAIGDYEWEQVNGRPNTETEYDSSDDPDVAALLRRRAKRSRLLAHMEMVHRVMNGEPPVGTEEVVRRRENQRRKRAGITGYESATTSDGELSAEKARGAAEKILGLPVGFFPDVDPEEERLMLQLANRLNREHGAALYEEAVRRVAEGRSNPAMPSEVGDADRRRAARAALKLARGAQAGVGASKLAGSADVSSDSEAWVDAGAAGRLAPTSRLELLARSSIGQVAPPDDGIGSDAPPEPKPHLLAGAEHAVEARRKTLAMRGRLDPSMEDEASRLQAREDRFGVRRDREAIGLQRAPDIVDAIAEADTATGAVSDEERQAAVAREALLEDRVPFAHAASGWDMPVPAIPAGASDSEAGSDLMSVPVAEAGAERPRGRAMSMDRPDGGLDLRVEGLEERGLSHLQWSQEDAQLEQSRVQEHERIAALAPGGVQKQRERQALEAADRAREGLLKVRDEEGAYGNPHRDPSAGSEPLAQELREIEGLQEGGEGLDGAVAENVREAARRLGAVGESLQRALKAAPKGIFGPEQKDLAVLLARAGELEPEVAREVLGEEMPGTTPAVSLAGAGDGAVNGDDSNPRVSNPDSALGVEKQITAPPAPDRSAIRSRLEALAALLASREVALPVPAGSEGVAAQVRPQSYPAANVSQAVVVTHVSRDPVTRSPVVLQATGEAAGSNAMEAGTSPLAPVSSGAVAYAPPPAMQEPNPAMARLETVPVSYQRPTAASVANSRREVPDEVKLEVLTWARDSMRELRLEAAGHSPGSMERVAEFAAGVSINGVPLADFLEGDVERLTPPKIQDLSPDNPLAEELLQQQVDMNETERLMMAMEALAPDFMGAAAMADHQVSAIAGPQGAESGPQHGLAAARKGSSLQELLEVERKRNQLRAMDESEATTDYEDPVMSDSSYVLDAVMGVGDPRTGLSAAEALTPEMQGMRQLVQRVLRADRQVGREDDPGEEYEREKLVDAVRASSSVASMRQALVELRVPGAESMTLAEVLAYEMPNIRDLPNHMLPPVPIEVVPGAPLDPMPRRQPQPTGTGPSIGINQASMQQGLDDVAALPTDPQAFAAAVAHDEEAGSTHAMAALLEQQQQQQQQQFGSSNLVSSESLSKRGRSSSRIVELRDSDMQQSNESLGEPKVAAGVRLTKVTGASEESRRQAISIDSAKRAKADTPPAVATEQVPDFGSPRTDIGPYAQMQRRRDAVARLHAADLTPPTLWDSTESVLHASRGDQAVATDEPPHAVCFQQELPWAGYDPLQVVDQSGYVFETVAKPTQAGAPGLVRRRRSGRPPQGEKLVPRPRSLTRAKGEKPFAVARLGAVTAQRAQRVARDDRARLREVAEEARSRLELSERLIASALGTEPLAGDATVEDGTSPTSTGNAESTAPSKRREDGKSYAERRPVAPGVQDADSPDRAASSGLNPTAQAYLDRLMSKAGLTRDGQLQPEQKHALLRKRGFQIRQSKAPVEARMAMVRVLEEEAGEDVDVDKAEQSDGLRQEKAETLRVFFGAEAAAAESPKERATRKRRQTRAAGDNRGEGHDFERVEGAKPAILSSQTQKPDTAGVHRLLGVNRDAAGDASKGKGKATSEYSYSVLETQDVVPVGAHARQALAEGTVTAGTVDVAPSRVPEGQDEGQDDGMSDLDRLSALVVGELSPAQQLEGQAELKADDELKAMQQEAAREESLRSLRDSDSTESELEAARTDGAASGGAADDSSGFDDFFAAARPATASGAGSSDSEVDPELEEFVGIRGIREQARKAEAAKARLIRTNGAEVDSPRQHGARVGIGSMGQASLSDAADSHLSEDERREFHAKRREAETLARERRALDDKYGDSIREYEAELDPASVGPVEQAVARATESLEHRRKRRKGGEQHGLIDALLGVRRLDEDDLDLAHLYEDHATGKDVREAVRRADEANRRGDTDTARALLEGVLTPGGTNQALLALAGTGPSGRPAPHHVAVLDATRREGAEPREALATLLGSGAVGAEQLLQASGEGRVSPPGIMGDGSPPLQLEGAVVPQGRDRRGEHDDPHNEAFEKADTFAVAGAGDNALEIDPVRLDAIVSGVDQARAAVGLVGGDEAALELTGDVRGSNADVDAILTAGEAAGVLSSHGRRVKAARQKLGELVQPGSTGELRLKALQRLSRHTFGGMEWSAIDLPEDDEPKARKLLVLGMQQVYDELVELGLRPDAVTLNVMVLGLANALMPHEAYGFIRSEFARWGEIPDAHTMQHLVHMNMRLRRMDDAHSLLETAKAAGIQPSAVTYGSLVHGYARDYRIADAVDVLREMKEKGLKCPEHFAKLLRHRCRDLDIWHPLVPEHPLGWKFRPENLAAMRDQRKEIRKERRQLRVKVKGVAVHM